MSNGLYALDLDTPIYNINMKKVNQIIWTLFTFGIVLLGHLGEKHIFKLHKDGHLDSFDYESSVVCESCLLGKMAKTPFTGDGEKG